MDEPGSNATEERYRLPFLASVVLRLSTARLRIRVLVVAVSSLIYAGAFITLFPLIGRAGIGLAVLPVIVSAVSFGLLPGIAAASLSIAVNLLMFLAAGDSAPLDSLGRNFWMSHLVFLLVGSAAGMMRDLWHRLAAELDARHRVEKELEFMARHDPLTGTLNRYALDEILHRELARAERFRRSIGFLMIDINRFKEVNDRFGHQMGDRVLEAIAMILLQQTRETDYVFRYGGDEFLVILPETDGKAALVEERIQSEVRRRNEINPLLEFPVTLAIGAIHRETGATGSPDELLAELDRRMYAKKNSAA